MADKLQLFLDKSFNGIELAPALFYVWEPGIRFEISNPKLSYTEPGYLTQAFERATALFGAAFDEDDEILFVTDLITWRNTSFIRKKPLNVYKKYIKQQQALYKLQLKGIELSEFDEGDITTHRFSYACRKKDIRYPQLLQAICYQDFGHPSKITNYQGSDARIYLINVSQQLIYHLYDDRGCDIIAADKEGIRFLYEQYNDWILDYDREKIDAIFK
ncbi:DUF3885 domain-containing protein [Planococcus halotolerans]|uniref:DUF3885 domain-containing protein n=1 Tax=Planococcus halotolerans TaxID=2233542 RepID=A0A365L8B9_9BACL|nr:DUF3885 domain-containing protein [Planococcus halotolerans]RAZ81361.1 hypothetical protein DP120_03515 [Planococcus halotolerans]